VTSPLSDDPPQREDERSVEDIAREVAGHTHDHAEDHRCWACIRVAAALRIEREARERAEAERDQIRMFLGDASPKSEKLWKEWLAERDSLSKRLERMEKALREIEAIRCGVLGHSVAVDCQASGIAHRALSPQAADPTEAR
jgi:hypothetical protein